MRLSFGVEVDLERTQDAEGVDFLEAFKEVWFISYTLYFLLFY